MAPFVPEAYAIDFGTSNSLLAAANGAEVHPAVPLDEQAEDPTVLRSVLFFPEADSLREQQCYFGKSALDEYVARGARGRLLRSLKRFLPARGFSRATIAQRSYTLEELIAAVLREMRLRADRRASPAVRTTLPAPKGGCAPLRAWRASRRWTFARSRSRRRATSEASCRGPSCS